MAGKKHVHKYYRLDMMGTKVWACALPNCSHYMPKHLEPSIANRLSVCWQCESDSMLMGPLQLERVKPICEKCMGIDEEPEISPALMELMKQKGLM